MENDFFRIYLKILLEDKCPITFTPNALLNKAVEKCYLNFSKGNYWTYSIKDIFNICEDELQNKQIFKRCLELAENIEDFAINIFYFKKILQ